MSIQPLQEAFSCQSTNSFFENHGAKVAVAAGAALVGIAAYGVACWYKKMSYKHPYAAKVEGSEQLKRTYDLNRMLSRIEGIEDKRVCLFIGRTPTEALPDEEGKVWVSGDIYVGEEIPEERIHLWLDFTDAKQLTCLHQHFDEIIIDMAVTKFLKGDFITRFVPLFKPSAESVFIFEPIPGVIGFGHDITEPEFNFSNYRIPAQWMHDEDEEKMQVFEKYQTETDETQQQKDYEFFLEEHQEEFEHTFPPVDEEDKRRDFMWHIIDRDYQPPETTKIEEAKKDMIRFVQEHCSQFFEDVTYHEATEFYGSTQSISGIYKYIVAKGIKLPNARSETA